MMIEPMHDKTKKFTCVPSAQSDQSLRCPHEETSGTKLLVEHTVNTLIRLGVILLVLS